MTLEEYEKALRDYDERLEALTAKEKTLRQQLTEAEDALANSTKLRTDFENFVTRKKQKNGSSSSYSMPKVFANVLAKVESMLSGPEFVKAEGNITEIRENISRKIRKLDDQLDTCRADFRELQAKRDRLVLEYMSQNASAAIT